MLWNVFYLTNLSQKNFHFIISKNVENLLKSPFHYLVKTNIVYLIWTLLDPKKSMKFAICKWSFYRVYNINITSNLNSATSPQYFITPLVRPFQRLLLCSWDKSLNIGCRMLRIFLKVPFFTFDSLNLMREIRSYSFYILVIGQKSFIFLMTFWIIWLCVCYNQGAKGIKEKGLSWKVSWSTK